MKYLKNPTTGEIVKGEAFGAAFDFWQELTESEIETHELTQAKLSKIAQLKINRNAALEKSHEASKAFEIIDDALGNEVYFEFSTKSTGIPLTEPKSILDIALKNINVKYSCEIIENGVRRKGYVLLNKELAEVLESHLTDRSNTDVKYANDLEAEINACTTLEELNNININFE